MNVGVGVGVFVGQGVHDGRGVCDGWEVGTLLCGSTAIISSPLLDEHALSNETKRPDRMTRNVRRFIELQI